MSTVTVQTISNGTVSTSSANVIQGSAKAWVNFNGSGGASIRASYNVSSVTRTGLGLYNVNFTNAMPNTNYAPQVTATRFSASTSYACSGFARPTTTSQVFVYTGYEDTLNGQIPTDAEFCYVAIFSS
jgi:hypothetical protein